MNDEICFSWILHICPDFLGYLVCGRNARNVVMQIGLLRKETAIGTKEKAS